MEARVAEMEEASIAPDFWSDQESAKATMRSLNALKDDVALWRGLESRTADLLELAPLVDPEDDPDLADEIRRDFGTLTESFGSAEAALLLDGDYDANDAVLSIHAGAGGTESQDWAQMLQRMYLRWAERRGYEVEIVDSMSGEEAGIKSCTMTIGGRNAYGLLRSERGVHRLVRISPFDASARRHTSFALVEVSPVIEGDVSVELREEDIRVDVFRASGAGGQHVNKTSSAVRMTHEPSGIVVTCQNERSQAQNRETAIKLLRARLLEQKLEEREAEQARLKGQHVDAGWGNQIRSYVLHPYQMVKDHRTKEEVGNAQPVLDGAIDGFIEAYLRFMVGDGRSADED